VTTPYPVRCAGRQAIVTLPEHIDVSNTGQIREELLSVINRGAATLIADVTARVNRGTAGSRAWARRVSGTAGHFIRAGQCSTSSRPSSVVR
jgi:hypothetical protein